MSRETLLDEAIAKAKEAEDWQLVEWLRMARGGESAARWYTKKLRELEDENARLRSCLSDDAETARLILGDNDKLRELCWCLLEAERVGETSRGWRELRDRARELGIEVDDVLRTE